MNEYQNPRKITQKNKTTHQSYIIAKNPEIRY